MCVHIRPDKPTRAAIWTSLLVGLVMLASAAQPGWGASMVIPPAGWLGEALIGASLLCGGGLSVMAYRRPTRVVTRTWAVDELGAWLTAGGWTAYSVIAAIAEPWAVAHWVISMGLAVAAIARIHAIRERRTHTEDAVARLREEA